MLGTGWLGWSPDLVLDAPIPQIILAIEGKADFARKSNPFGGGEKKKAPALTEAQQRKVAEQRTRFALMKLDAKQRFKARQKNEQHS